MTTTPIGPLVTFCIAMAAIAIGRLARGDERDPVDAGATLIVVGVTWVTAVRLAFEYGWVAATAQTLLGTVGGAIVCAGLGVMVRHWNGEAGAFVASRRRGTGDDADVGSDSETEGDRDRA
ncbi:hypothetical protein [Halosolutus gelatinilyticus]|uniref:hypothetical protein n=1 Tax=Halosolutus gelatinilyticus TaxID=2931975 RepID=UPI001FF3F595|nr:hypothetical protein [Halosolutus gelatinilyticus]